MAIRLVKRNPLHWWQRLMLPFGAVFLAVLFSSLFILLAGANPIQAWLLIIEGSMGSRFSFLETLVKMAPLSFCGLAVAVAFKAKFWNIGAEGQLYVGAFMAAWLGTLPLEGLGVLHIPLIIIFGFVGSGLFAMLPGLLKVRFKVDDVVSTLLLNYIVIFLLGALLEGPWRDPVSGWPHSERIASSAEFPTLLARSRLHLGILLAFVAAGGVWFLFAKTTLGYRIKAVGENIPAARFGGISTPRAFLSACFISGGLAGMAGVGEVCAVQYYVIEGISPGFGYFGIAVAMLGALNPFGALLAAFFFAAVITGAQAMSRATGVPVYLAEMIQGITLITMLFMLMLDRYKIVFDRKKACGGDANTTSGVLASLSSSSAASEV